MSTTAYAQSSADTTPPTVSAKPSGEMLHIEASDDNSGVDAVFIDGKRVNYRVDSAVDVIFKDYAGTDAKVSVYAVDFAGNQSAVVSVNNPYYKAAVTPTPAPTTKPTTKPSASASADPEQTPSTDTKPLTPDGQASVTDNVTDKDGKEFYTFTTANENVFYLVIDKQRDSDNVYFLNAVTEDDLVALAEKPKGNETAMPEPIPVCSCKEKCEPGAVDTACTLCMQNLKECTGKIAAVTEETESKPAKKEGGNTGMIIFILIAAVTVGGAGYYFKIYKPKQELDDAEDFDELTGGTDEPTVNEDDEEMTRTVVTEDAPENEVDEPSKQYGDEPDEPDYPDGEPDEPEEWQ